MDQSTLSTGPFSSSQTVSFPGRVPQVNPPGLRVRARYLPESGSLGVLNVWEYGASKKTYDDMARHKNLSGHAGLTNMGSQSFFF